ncbi:MAG: hypothetical protein U5M23_01430 [Marinagarivorans sp.]|nr:hypothetical protein [Marinagarivorans sp.]
MHSVTGKLNKNATEFSAGDSIGFGIKLGVKYRDRKTNDDKWTNYSAAIFAKSDSQINFYRSVLVDGAIVSVSSEKIAIETFDGQNGQLLSIDMLNAKLTFAYAPQQQPQPQQYQQQYQQQGQQLGPQNNAYAQASGGTTRRPPPQNGVNYDEDIPF